MKDNIPGFMGYYVSKTGSVYSRYVRGSRGKLSNEFTPLIPKKRPLSELIQLGFTKWKVNKTLLMVLGKRFGVGDRVIRNILNNSYENKESRGSKR